MSLADLTFDYNAAALLPVIVALPLLGGIVTGLFGKHLSRGTVHVIANTAVLAPFFMAVLAFVQLRALTLTNPDAALRFELYRWIAAGSYTFDIAFLFDPLSAVMCLVVAGVGFLVHLYSTAYMEDDKGYARYFSYLNLFVFSMLMLVLGKNLAMLFIGWEGVGACSYLLIGFWFKDMDKAVAGQKAFIVNRIGDIGFVIAIFLLLAYANGSVDYDSLRAHFSDAHRVLIDPATITLICLLLFVGAAGKSAQIPLYVWLPDAMAGPTPVSALIHAATMVTAGVYMVARMNFLYALSPAAMTVVMVVGALTAVVAASIGLAQNDIKKVLAYSTVSQLGYMFVAVGAGAFAAGIFHLFTHAFFKACLFLGAGAVIYGLHHEQDIRNMGGLKAKMKVTHWTFLVACLAIAGLPPLAGFFSKDAILAETVGFHPDTEKLSAYYDASFKNQALRALAREHKPGTPFEADSAKIDARHKQVKAAYVASVEKLAIWRKVALALCLLGALMTAFYMFRLYFLTFWGQFRGDPHAYHDAKDAPLSMALALQILAVLSIAGGWLGMPFAHGKLNWFWHWLDPVFARGHEFVGGHLSAALEYGLMGASVTAFAIGAGVAWSFYKDGPSKQAAAIAASARGLHAALLNKWYVDELYDAILIKPLRSVSMALFQVVDRVVIDTMLVSLPGWTLSGLSYLVRFVQTGEVQVYLVGIVAGLTVLVMYSL
ncbi:MAG: NADH-quinone oxidoreductase subunit L [Myxococcales bacterium]|nr:NADH-quinone oxidoreductase subunit L [Myxococcales bacterium]